MARCVRFFFVVALVVLASACPYRLRPSDGGGEQSRVVERKPQAADVAVAPGYAIEVVAQGLTFPSDVAFDGAGAVYVVESGSGLGVSPSRPRILRISPGGEAEVWVEGSNAPWTAAVAQEDGFFISEGGGPGGPGRIVRIARTGERTVLVDDLPSRGDHRTNALVLGPDGALYFAVGSATNSGVVGPDNLVLGGLSSNPDLHDVPCQDLILTGANFESEDPLNPAGPEVLTGAYVPLGTKTEPGQVVHGRIPCGGAVFRVPTGGGPLELIASGFRDPSGLAFSPDGALFTVDQGYDVRGSRPVFGSADALWRVEHNVWYGWPDFSAGRPLPQNRFQAPWKPVPPRLLATWPNVPPQPAALLPVNANGSGMDFSTAPAFGFAGEVFVALFGDLAPFTGKLWAPVGFEVVRIDPATGAIHSFAVNRGSENGPASALGTGGFERPTAARFSPDGKSLYVVDFGIVVSSDRGVYAVPGTGALWRIWHEGGSRR